MLTNEGLSNEGFSTAYKTSHCPMKVHHRVKQFLSEAVTIYMTASSNGENNPRRGGGGAVSRSHYNTKDLWVTIFCYIMIINTLCNDNDDCSGINMNKTYIPFH